MPWRRTARSVGRHHLVGLAEELPALGMADDDEGHAQPGQHGRRHLAREGTLVLAVTVLGAEGAPGWRGPR